MKSAPTASLVLAAVLDLVLITIFAFIGRASHGESTAGVAVTAWPFIAGLAVGWALTRAWQHPFRVRWTGLLIWPITVVVGMLLRSATGQGVQFSFVIVTAVVLGVFLLGWRVVAGLLGKRRGAVTDTISD